MYISNVEIKNYRSYKSIKVNFHDGINLLIGHNNAGKSNLLRALGIVFNSTVKKQLLVEDFNNEISLEELKKEPPKIVISIELKQSEQEDLMGDELVTVSDWLITLEEPYKAKIQYEFFLPEKERELYMSKVSDMDTQAKVWDLIQNDFIRKYINKTWVGNPDNQVSVNSDDINKFDFQFLDAIRDVERDMYSGKNTLLKNVIDFFMDYEIKSNKELTEEQQKEEIDTRRKVFSTDSQKLIEQLQCRLSTGNTEILSYVEEVGASFDKSKPSFQGKITESEIYSILQLIVQQETGLTIPISHNGLGYNNLIFMSLLLAKMQVDSDGKYLGSNAKVFPILAIEEPEAHLHPTMQYQFVKFLKENIKKKKVKQAFITSHSTHISTATDLDDIICFYRNEGHIQVAYPGKVFNNTGDDGKEVVNLKSKKYVQRFLDATKSNLFFAERIILVEGIAEQLLLPVLADYKNKSLEDNHVAVINVGGRYFEHFLNLFNDKNSNAIKRKVACITDLDPTRRKKKDEGNQEKYSVCYPYEYLQNNDEYDYQCNEFLDKYKKSNNKNIVSFSQPEKYGKTLEYQIILENPSLKVLITDSIANATELSDLMSLYEKNEPRPKLMERLADTKANDRIRESLDNADKTWTEDNKKCALIASRYLNSVGKGENALELATALKENLELLGTKKYQEFIVPQYISDAIDWVCE